MAARHRSGLSEDHSSYESLSDLFSSTGSSVQSIDTMRELLGPRASRHVNQHMTQRLDSRFGSPVPHHNEPRYGRPGSPARMAYHPASHHMTSPARIDYRSADHHMTSHERMNYHPMDHHMTSHECMDHHPVHHNRQVDQPFTASSKIPPTKGPAQPTEYRPSHYTDSHDRMDSPFNRHSQPTGCRPTYPPNVPQYGGSTLNPRAPDWIPRGYEPPHIQHQRSDFEMRRLIDMVSLPKTSIMTFDGDPMNFYTFMNTFDIAIDSTSVHDGAKLNLLFEYCTGKAYRVIKPCALLPPQEGYKRARRLLHERFGDEYTIAEAWIHKVCDGPSIRSNSGSDLQDFADDARGCLETLKAMNKVGEIDNRIRMVKVCDRLPFHLQNRWRKEAVKKKEEFGTYPNIEDLVFFIDRAAKKAQRPSVWDSKA